MALVVLMLPSIGGAGPGTAGLGTEGGRTDARSYKVSLTADADTATIDVDGRRLARAPVQRVLPGDHQRFVVRPSPGGGLATAEIVPPNQNSPQGSLRERQIHRPPSPSPPKLSLNPPHEMLSPNGAPIID